jgi:hypothetical protein
MAVAGNETEKRHIPGWIWGSRDRKTIRLCAIVASFFVANMVFHLYAITSRGTQYPFDDFFALWSYAKVALTSGAAVLYDFPRLHAAQVSLGMAPATEKPFPYPPLFLFMVLPLGLLPYMAAYAVWIGATLSAYVCAVCRGIHPRWLMLQGALLAPTTAINLGFGQSGFLLAALLIGGVRLREARPVLAGILFGLLSYKPQFGLLVPVMLIAEGRWRCIASACVTLVVLAIGASAAFGPAIWGSWLHALSAYAAWFDDRTIGRGLRITVDDNLLAFGWPPAPASMVQMAAAVFAAAVVWVSFRHGSRARAVPTMIVAACLAAPHAFIYDLPVLTGAVLLFVADRVKSGLPFVLPEVVILLLVLVFPAVMWDFGLPVSGGAIALFMALLLTPGISGSYR